MLAASQVQSSCACVSCMGCSAAWCYVRCTPPAPCCPFSTSMPRCQPHTYFQPHATSYMHSDLHHLRSPITRLDSRKIHSCCALLQLHLDIAPVVLLPRPCLAAGNHDIGPEAVHGQRGLSPPNPLVEVVERCLESMAGEHA